MHAWCRSVGAVIVLALAVCLAAPPSAVAEPVRLTILHFNDLDRMEPENGQGGIAEVATLLAAERARADHSLTTFGGDAISPSLMSGLDQGAHMIALFNAIGVDVAVLGNHEFDFGPDPLRARIAESRFPWLATNVVQADGSVLEGARETWTVEVAGVRLGFLGLITSETAALSSPSADIGFLDPVEMAHQAADRLREDGADLVIALTHQDLDEDLWLLQEVGAVDLVLGGHDHNLIGFFDGRAALLKSAAQGRYLGVLDLHVEKSAAGVEWRPEIRMVSSAGVTPDSRVAGMVSDFLGRLDSELGREVAVLGAPLDTRNAAVRTAENAFGNLIADTLLAATETDVALVNGGSIRGDRSYRAGDALSRKDILGELPFRNRIAVLSMSGADLLRALENGLSMVEDGAGRFPHVAGLSLAYDPARPPGSRLLTVEVSGAALDQDAFYDVATIDFLAQGGDGYTVFTRGEPVADGAAHQLLAQVLIDRWTAAGRIAPRLDGRLRRRATLSGQ